MSYTYDRLLVDVHIDEADKRIRDSLRSEGFGLLTEIDVKETLKKKIGVDLNGYRILGACNPAMAYKALALEPKIGAMLPYNVIVRSVEDGTEISAIDPVASMTAIDNQELIGLAHSIRTMLIRAVDAA